MFSKLPTSFMSDFKPLNVRRCLFGREDPEKLSKDLHRKEQIMYKEDARRFREEWGFDPVTGPIEGGKFHYEVITVDSSCETVPSFYLKGYTSRKSRPARIIRDRSFCSVNDFSRSNYFSRSNSAKRKLDLVDQENDENEVTLYKRVPQTGEIINSQVSVKSESMDFQVQHVLSSDVDDSEEYRCNSRLCEVPAGLTHSSSSASSLAELSPASRNKDVMTPSRPKSLVQSSIKDFLPNKKQRMLNTKALPRT